MSEKNTEVQDKLIEQIVAETEISFTGELPTMVTVVLNDDDFLDLLFNRD